MPQLPPPSPKTNVPRLDVGQEVDAMLMDDRIRWVAVVFERNDGMSDRFTVTPWTEDPTGAG